MKKLVCACLMLGLVASSAFALPGGLLPYGVGAKYAGMGGAGAALVDDVTSAYFNPAGITRAQSMSMKLGAGAATDGLDKLVSTLGNMTDPSKFLLDNYANAINVNGTINAFLGIDIMKTGISVTPASMLYITKLPLTVAGSAGGGFNADAAVTMGWGVGVPYLGNIAVGANAKYVMSGVAGALVAGATSTTMTYNYTGMGFDLGAQAKMNAIPTVPLSVGIVLKDIGETLSGKLATTTKTINPLTGQVLSEVTTNADLPGYTSPTTLTIGAAGKIPVVGLTVAIDLDNVSGGSIAGSPVQPYSVTHIGLEYPVAMGLVNLRLGKISGGQGGSIDMTTYGAGILGNMINIAMVSDGKNSKNNQTTFDVGFGF